ncbi:MULTISPECIES: immune inhibitor A [Actinosynnema]|uniref:immune inhibitor A n=1 Tax=Actinosynnema TaxID=40566 RepID=UPI0020A35306|nr:immune inhibitor A [Actinosynnema pretiosum]MCP2097120.1 hypothetical protein [Actinosynnema pretiosum]
MTYEPFPGGEGAVVGIESLTLDGTRYYFAFNYPSDFVLSPLIDDAETMAAFAAEHFTQTDGKHDAAYWAELVEIADEDSGLAEFENTFFESEELERGETTYHLRYLLGAACAWDGAILKDAEVLAALDRLGLGHEWDDLDKCTELDGDDAEYVVERYFDHIAELLQGNWRTVFAPLFDR